MFFSPTAPTLHARSLHAGQESPPTWEAADTGAWGRETCSHPILSSLEIVKEVPNTIHAYVKLWGEDQGSFLSHPLTLSLHSSIFFFSTHLSQALAKAWNILAPHPLPCINSFFLAFAELAASH